MKKAAFIYVIAAGVLWGTSGIFAKLLYPIGFSPLHITVMRCLTSAIIMSAYILIFKKSLFRISLKGFIFSIFSGLAMFAAAAFYYSSMKATTISTAVVLMYTSPILVMGYSVAFLGEKLTFSKLISVICMLVGCGLVSGIIGGLKFDILGVVFGFLAGISYATYSILTKLQMRRNIHPSSAALYSYIFAAIASIIVSSPEKMLTITANQPLVVIPLWIGIGIFTMLLPYFLYTVALQKIPAGTASALGIVEPMSATIFSIVFFGEKLGILSFCGIVLILGSVLLLSRGEITISPKSEA